MPGSRRPGDTSRDESERIHKAIQATKIMAPPTDCIAPIGEALIETALDDVLGRVDRTAG